GEVGGTGRLGRWIGWGVKKLARQNRARHAEARKRVDRQQDHRSGDGRTDRCTQTRRIPEGACSKSRSSLHPGLGRPAGVMQDEAAVDKVQMWKEGMQQVALVHALAGANG